MEFQRGGSDGAQGFLSFECEKDVGRALVDRNSWVVPGGESAGFIDAIEFGKRKMRGVVAAQRRIDSQLAGAGVKVVLVGQFTCSSRRASYEIAKSKALGHCLLGIDISKIRDWSNQSTDCYGKRFPSFTYMFQSGIETAPAASGQRNVNASLRVWLTCPSKPGDW